MLRGEGRLGTHPPCPNPTWAQRACAVAAPLVALACAGVDPAPPVDTAVVAPTTSTFDPPDPDTEDTSTPEDTGTSPAEPWQPSTTAALVGPLTDVPPARCDELTATFVQDLAQADLALEVIGDLPVEHGPGLALGDLDLDGDLDALLAVRGARLVVLDNDGTGTLTPTAGWTVDGGPLPDASAVALADVDGDGDLDVALGRAEGSPDLVLRQVAVGQWSAEELPDSAGERVTPTFFDADGDGWLDLFVGAYVHEFDPTVQTDSDGTGLYLSRDGGSRFELATDRLPQRAQRALAFQGAPLDAEGDGDLDLFLSTDCYAAGVCEIPPMLLLNDGAGWFTEAEDCACDGRISAMGASVGDPDDDGDADLYVSNFGPSRFYLNEGDGSFLEALMAFGLEPFEDATYIGWGSRFVDVDMDGDDELYLTTGGTLPFYSGSTTLTELPGALFRDDGLVFDDVTAELGIDTWSVGRSVVSGDLDGDGRPELVLSSYLRVRVLAFGGGCPNAFTLRLDAGPGNRQGIGARVEMTVGDRTSTHRVLPSGTFSSSSPALHLGLGTSATASRVTVRWPDGATTTVEDVAAGSELELSRWP
jgi:hypothetical protein